MISLSLVDVAIVEFQPVATIVEFQLTVIVFFFSSYAFRSSSPASRLSSIGCSQQPQKKKKKKEMSPSVPKLEDEKKPQLLSSHLRSLLRARARRGTQPKKEMPSSVPKQEDEKKPSNLDSSMITLKVKSQNKEDVVFKIRRGTQLRKLMNSYCERQVVEYNTFVFLVDGTGLRGNQTADELGLNDGDEIDAMLHQHGGSFNG